jgi:hypothetical protein
LLPAIRCSLKLVSVAIYERTRTSQVRVVSYVRTHVFPEWFGI